ncbi:MAG: DoxX family membrane protein [Conexibacter sp.]
MESAALPRHDASANARPLAGVRDDAGYQAFLMLRVAFAIAPIAFGLDKFFNVLVHWPKYLAPWIDNIVPGSAQQAMYAVGAIEIVAGLLVALKPRYGAPLVAAWLGGIVVNLLTYSGFYDIALRDFGLMLAALTLTRLAWHYDRPFRS